MKKVTKKEIEKYCDSCRFYCHFCKRCRNNYIPKLQYRVAGNYYDPPTLYCKRWTYSSNRIILNEDKMKRLEIKILDRITKKEYEMLINERVKHDEYDAVAEMEANDRYGDDMKRFEDLQGEIK